MTYATHNTQHEPPLTIIDLAARFPLETVAIPIADQQWRVTCVIDQDALLDGVNEVDHVPYGFLLWESALLLAQQLVTSREQVRGKRVLELGAGVGLAGLMAHRLGATVWQTDHRADLLVVAAHNAAQNQLTPPTNFWRTGAVGSIPANMI